MKVDINQAQINVMFQDQNGGVAGELKRVADEFAAASRIAVGVQRTDQLRSPGPNPFRQSGAIQRSIETEGPMLEDDGQHNGGVVVYVVSNKGVGNGRKTTGDYAHVLLDGTGPGGVAYKFLPEDIQAKLTYE